MRENDNYSYIYTVHRNGLSVPVSFCPFSGEFSWAISRFLPWGG